MLWAALRAPSLRPLISAAGFKHKIQGETMYRLSRALVGAALLLLTSFGVAAHAAQGSYEDPTAQGGSAYSGGQKFSIAVIPDTQYLFDEDRNNPQVLAKTLQWIVDHTREKNIVFT